MPVVTVDESPALFTRPELLQQYDIPWELGGVNPRTILGREWWDTTRREAYAKNNYRCFACGCRAPEPLDAHECYTYDYESKIATYTETVALCKQCHMFIHCVLWLMQTSFMPSQRYHEIMHRGAKILADADLAPNVIQRTILGIEFGSGFRFKTVVAIHRDCVRILATSGWKLAALGKVYNALGKEIKDETISTV